jgi:hypothetical protein
VSFTSGFVTLRPGATAAMQVLSLGVGVATQACVEAWNAPRVCQPLPPNPGVQQF